MAYEYQVDVGGVMYSGKQIKSANLTQPLYDKFSPGNACAAEFTLTFWPEEEPPTMAKVIPYIREAGEAEWNKLGEFYIDTREQQGTALEIVCYDGMLRAEDVWEPDQDLEFPMAMGKAAEIISNLMDIPLDERCSFNDAYTIDYPVNKTLREKLCDIAGAHLGNWIVTSKPTLLLVPLFGSMPKETFYLVTERGAPIQIGNVGIHV